MRMLLLALLMIGALNFVANGQTNPDYKYDNPRVLDKSVIKVPVMKEGFAPAGQAEIRLDKKFYNAGDFISATVSKNSKMPVYHPFVVFVSPKTGDAEESDGEKLVHQRWGPGCGPVRGGLDGCWQTDRETGHRA